MVSVQADCTLDEALFLMQSRAGYSRVSVDAIAGAVVDGSIRFDE